MFMKKATKLLPFIGICIMIYLILRTGPGLILETFLTVNVKFLFPAFFLFFLYLIIQNYKWGYLAKKQGIRLGFWTMLKIYLIGAFYGLITPGRIGNFIRIRYLKKRTGKGTGECGVSVIIDKVLDFAALFGLAVIGIISVANFISIEMFAIITAIFLTFFFSLLVFACKKTSWRIVRIFWRLFVPARMKTRTKDAFNTFYDNLLEWRQLLLPFGLTLIGWLVLYSSTYTIALSLDINVPYTAFVTMLPVATLIGLIPITVGGWGTREAALVLLFSIFGVGSEAVIVMSIMAATLSYVITAVFGIAFAFSVERQNNKES